MAPKPQAIVTWLVVLATASACAGCTVNLGVPAANPTVAVATSAPASSAPPVKASAAPSRQSPSQIAPAKPARSPTAEPEQRPVRRLNLPAARTAPDPSLPWIVQGKRGDGARCVQHALNLINDAQLPVDGYYGPVSRRALEAFQLSIGIKADGEVGPATGRWLATYYDAIQGTGAWARTGCYSYVPARRG